MGRSRGVFHSDDDPSQRSRRKKNASSGENIEAALGGQGTGDGKRALYHCNYCNKDITGRIRIKCAVCSDFDLCVECFSVGAEMQPHKSNHLYRVMDSLSFPLMTPDWNADEEILLLEGLEMYGLGNWAEVAEHVGTKNKQHCINHYKSVYLNSPFFPLPDMTHVVGKNRNDLLAMAKGNNDEKKGSTPSGDHTLKQEASFSPSRVKVEDLQKGGPSSRFIQCTDSQVERNPIGKKPPKEEDSSLFSLSGYNPKRREFDPEYDVDAEQLLADMEFKEADTDEERDLKLRVLRIYCKRLDERTRRKDFIIERNLLNPSPFEKDLSAEEKALCRQYDPFMRFHSKEDHEDMILAVIAEHRTLKRIRELEEGRAAGCRTSAEADRYLQNKRTREAEESRGRATEGALGGPVSQGGRDTDDLARYPGKELLSEDEKRLCHEMKISPQMYLKMQEAISVKIFSGNVASKGDAHGLMNMEPSKIDRIYDMLIKKGIAPP